MATAKAERRSQTERRDEAEQRLFKAAVTLIAERGLERLTLAEVGEAAGYSRGLPAHYFGSKAGLIVTLAERLVEDFGRALERVERHQLGLARLLGTVRFYLDSAMRDPIGARALYELLGEAVSSPLIRDQIARLNARSARAFEINLVAAIQAGDVRADIDPAAQAMLILGALRGAVSLWLLSPDGVDLPQVRDALVGSLERSLAA
jgi:AcrR family transcriptional regulator